jgi:hypothetical protein
MANKHIIKGKKGETVCYTLTNFRFDNNDNKLKWDSFKFYTPAAVQIDEQGFAYFDVPGDEISIERDPELNKKLIIKITISSGTEAIEILEGAESEPISIGKEGDIVASGFIPADTTKEITIDFQEVIDDTD